jgi:endonuclease/exonuclease/phosphatase (EEP) superfamily protein YafD
MKLPMSSKSKTFFRLLGDRLIPASCYLVMAISWLGVFRSWHWFAALLDHGHLQFGAISLPCVIYFVWKKWRWSMAFAAVTMLAHLWPIVQTSFPAEAGLAADHTPGMKVVSFNVYVSNTRHADTLAYLQSSDADVICLYEVNKKWIDSLEPLRKKYPHGVSETKEHGLGIALYSRHPLRSFEIKRLCAGGMPCAVADLSWHGRDMRIIGFHPLPPISEKFSHLLSREFESMASMIAEKSDMPTVVVGDFNSTPWSADMRLLRRNGGLDFRTPAPVWFPTWNARSVWMLPIDHALCSKHLFYQSRVLGPDLGSDHLPQELDVRWVR